MINLTRNSFRKTLMLSFIICLSFLLMATVNAENSTDNNLTANDDVVIVNDEPLKSGSFMELSQKINETPENQEHLPNEHGFISDDIPSHCISLP